MGDIAENLAAWDQTHEWPQQGDEWSEAWGGARSQWWGTLFPRIHPFLPTGTVLEIAPGYGRWTQFLRGVCRHLIAVDLSANCITACQQRFAEMPEIELHVNDGRSLDMIADRSIDFVFSFDSLVHAEQDVIRDYLVEIERKLTPDGVGFLHHSNVHALLEPWGRSLPEPIARRVLKRVNMRVNKGWRSQSMSASRFVEACDAAGLQCITQEIVNWGVGQNLTDCLSTFTRKGSCWSRPVVRFVNNQFMAEAQRVRQIAVKPAREDRTAQ